MAAPPLRANREGDAKSNSRALEQSVRPGRVVWVASAISCGARLLGRSAASQFSARSDTPESARLGASAVEAYESLARREVGVACYEHRVDDHGRPDHDKRSADPPPSICGRRRSRVDHEQKQRPNPISRTADR